MLAIVRSFFIVLAVAAVGALPATAGEKPDAPTEIEGATTVDTEGVIGLFDTHPDLIILDNRKVADFEKGHIEGAVRLINTEVSEETMAEAVSAKDAPVLMYCNGIKCGRAADAVKKAVDLGYSQIYYYAVGMAEWNEKGMPVETN